MSKNAPGTLREVAGPSALGAWGASDAFGVPPRSRTEALSPGVADAPVPPLYLADELGWLRRVDPLTLADDSPDLPAAIHRGDPGNPARWRLARWFAPADGSTLVRLDFPMLHNGVPHHDVTIAVFAGPEGELARKIPAPAYPIGAWLSADGRRLITSKFEDEFLEGGVGPSTWHVVDLASGAIRSAARFAAYDGEPWTWPVLDPAGRTAYRLVPLPGVDPVATGGLALKAIDVATGVTRANLALPGLRISRLRLHRRDRVQQEVELGPALAVSPDGQTLALAHPDGRGVTLIEAATLTVRRQLVKRGAADDRARTGELIQHSAWDWPPARTALFGPDGSRLYLAGFGPSLDPDDPIASVDYGLKVLDLVAGTVHRDPLALAVSELAPAPDGSGVYVAGLRPERWGSQLLGERAALRRLDPLTLATLAERTDILLDEARVLLPWRASAG